MKPVPYCVPDALEKILATAKAVSDDDFIHRKVLMKVMCELAEDGSLGSHPADIYLQCWESACRALGVRDPYENEKARGDKTALGVLKYIEEHRPADLAADPLRFALKLSFAGAMLEYSGLGRADMQEKTLSYLDAVPAVDHTDALVAALDRAERVLLVANRAGEIVLDRPLVEVMAARGKKVYVVVSAKPVFLMATEKDVRDAGYPGSVQVVNPGTSMYGLVQERASSEFRGLLSGAGLVIVKGNTHFATMAPQRDVFFILKAEDAGAAERLGICPGDGAIARRSAGDTSRWIGAES